MRREVERVQGVPSDIPSFKALDLNLAISPTREMVCAPDDLRSCFADEIECRGRAYVAFDVGEASSGTAAAAYWPASGALRTWLAFGNVPDLKARASRDGADYLAMQRRGELRTYPGRVVPLRAFVADVRADLAGATVRAAVADAYKAGELRDCLPYTGSLSGWIEKRLSEEASAPTGSFLEVAKYEPGADVDLADPDADDPLGALRADIGSAKGQTLLVESQMSLADSPASAPRRDYQTARFGADPPRDLVELREAVARDIGAACGVPRALLDSTASGQAARESWRQFVSTSVAGLARRIEAQIGEQLGVAVTIDTSPLGGRDLAGRASAFARLIKGGLPVDAARRAAGI